MISMCILFVPYFNILRIKICLIISNNNLYSLLYKKTHGKTNISREAHTAEYGNDGEHSFEHTNNAMNSFEPIEYHQAEADFANAQYCNA